jgi:hypothetical protein
MGNFVTSGMLIAVGVIHLLPLSGVLGSEKLSSLYGIAFHDPNLIILMRHRAVLFGILGAFQVYSAFNRSYQTAGYISGLISVTSFLLLAKGEAQGYNDSIGRVVAADYIALGCLLVGFCWATFGGGDNRKKL